MNNYIEPIKIALIFFPFIAFVISVPFVLVEYHRFGSLSFLKSLIIYSFVFYIICAYFLIILPLPERSEVLLLKTPRMQLIPFKFIYDFIKETNFTSFFKIFINNSFIVPLYNIFLTMPFAIYIRYYFKIDLKQTLKYTFLLSLFFELTQLSGLYFLYPRSYRLFDIDDLFLNTLGGLIGYYIAPLLIKHLPERVKLEKEARKKGRKISGFRRLSSLLLDLFLYMIFTSIVSSIFHNVKFTIISIITIFIYYVVIPFILGGSTLAEKYLNLKVVDMKDKNNILKLFLRRLFFIISYIVVPIILLVIAMFIYYNVKENELLKITIICIYAVIVIVMYSVSIIKYVFTDKQMLYEKLSTTKMISTIK